MNTFDGANSKFPNLGLHFFVAEVIKFRKQLTVRSELRSQSGWDNALNHYMVVQLEALADTLETITYNPDHFAQEELEEQAGDTTRSLGDDYNERALSSDNVLMPVGSVRETVWKLDGADVDIPQLTPANCPNDTFRAFVTGLDRVYCEATRTDSRHQTDNITKYESTVLRALLNSLYTLTQRKGGEVNKSDIPQGTLPSQEAATFKGE